MKYFQVPLHGSIFLALFKGFANCGGYSGSNWSEQRLQSVWEALLQALDRNAEGLYVDTWLAIWALRAFDRCSTPVSVFRVYNSLSLRWKLSGEDSDFMIGFLHNLLKYRPGHMKLLRALGSRSHS